MINITTMLVQRSIDINPSKDLSVLEAANDSFFNGFCSEDADRGKRMIAIEILERQLLGGENDSKECATE